MKPYYNMSQLKKMGIDIANGKADDKAALLKFEQKDSDDYWLGLKNFYVITRYNHSPLYAMAVYQLSEEIAARMDAK